jgi:ribosomal protein L23
VIKLFGPYITDKTNLKGAKREMTFRVRPKSLKDTVCFMVLHANDVTKQCEPLNKALSGKG